MISSQSPGMTPPTATSETCAIRAAEVWRCGSSVPQRHQQLSCAGYRPGNFDVGDLVAEVVQSRQPALRAHLSSEADIDCAAGDASTICQAVALPTIVGGEVASVLVLILEYDTGCGGGVEYWEISAERRELGWSWGAYQELRLLGRTSRHIKFPFGAGLPGVAWRTSMPQLLPEAATHPGFVRAALADQSPLDYAFALPMQASRDELLGVFVVLGVRHSPVAGALTVWKHDAADDALTLQRHCVASVFANSVRFAADRSSRVTAFAGIAGKAWSSRTPVIGPISAEDCIFEGMTVDQPFSLGIALPHVIGTRVEAVSVIYV